MARTERVGPESASADDRTTVTLTLNAPTLFFVGLAVVVLASGIYLGRRVGQARAQANAQAQAQAGGSAVVDLPEYISPGLTEQEFEINPGTVFDLEFTRNHPLVETAAPEITGKRLDGTPIKLSDLRGQRVMVNFWATWCPPCRMEMPFMQEAYDHYRDQGFEILAVNAGERVGAQDVERVVSQFVEENRLTFPILLPEDPFRTQAEYRVSGLPSSYMVDREGNIESVHPAMYPNRATLNAHVEQLLDAQADTQRAPEG
jgi:thiol-disulfide isomerase/thioredoxin